MSSTHASRAHHRHASFSHASRHATRHSLFPAFALNTISLAPITGCGSTGTIADASGFEDADGNLAINHTGCMDWNGFTPTWTGTAPFETGTASNNGFDFVGATDAFNSTSDSIYAGGVKQDTVCPATVTGKANDKADLAAMYVSTEQVGDQTYLFLAWERQLDTTVQSDVFISFELNQGNVSCGTGSPFVERTPGDLLIEYNFQSGNSTIDVQEWDGTTWVPLPTPPYEAAVNTGTVTDTIRPDSPVDLTTFEFGEAGVNLSALDLTGNGGKACETFGSVLGSSRTSKSGDTAQLKDFIGPAPFDISNCVQPTVTTTLKNAADNSTITNGSSIADGSSVYDTATLGNLGSATPTGQVQYTFFTNGDCSGTGTSAGLKTLNNDGTVPHSDTKGPLAPGNYSFEAQYLSGNDQHYSDSDVSDCEPFTVNKAQLTVTTKVHDSSHTDITNDSVALGSVVHDTAKLSGVVAGQTPAAITFAFYSQADCGGSPTAVANTGADQGDATAVRSAASAALDAGSYSYKASVAGDSNYLGDDSDCENFTVNKAQLTATTKVHDASHTDITNSSVALGSVVHDTAKLSGVVAGKTPAAITFAFYSQADCGGDAVAVANIGADEGDNTADRSAASAALDAGSYSYKASVADNANYLGDSSDCENFTVNKAQLTATTKVHDASHTDITNSSVALGSVVHDTAKLSGLVAGKTPAAVTFAFYSQADCGGDAVAVANTGADEGDNTADRSAASAALDAGSYSYKASVADNANYLGDSSDCENFTVNKAQLTAATKVHDSNHTDITNGSVALGSVVHDTAKLSGVVAGKSPAAITFAFYSQADCAGSPTAVANIGADEGDNTADRSAASAALDAGAYSYKASVADNANYLGDSSDCENFTVNKAQLTAATKVHDSSHTDITNSSVALGSVVHDTAKLSGVVAGKTPAAITFAFYSQADCGGDAVAVANTGADEGDNTADRSAASAALGAGDYSYKASVADNANYLGDSSDCENFSVGKAQLTVTTKVHDAGHTDITNGAVALGSVVHDTAKLSGVVAGKSPAAITFAFYSQADCGGDAVAVANIGADEGDNTADRSAASAALDAGAYSYKASVAGDANYVGDSSDCENFTVNKAQLTAATKVHDASHTDITNDSVAVGSVVHDTAKLSGLVAGKSPAAITFAFYSQADCGGDAVAVANTGADEGDATADRSAASAALGAGDYSYKASVADNANYLGDSSDCENFTVNKAQPKIVTTQDPASGSVGDTYNDTATLSDAVMLDGTGTITFTLYDASGCDGNVIDTEVVHNISANGDYSTPTGVQLNTAGTYYWVASFSSDSNNLSAVSGCDDEPVVVKPAAIHIVKTADAARVDVGRAIGFTLTVFNDGSGAAHGVTLSDTLPTNAGLSWSIASQGAGWNGSCAIAAGVLSCGPVTVPAGTTQAASTFTVHITSPTTGATGGDCPTSGVVNNTGTVATTNAGSDESSASTCVQALVDLTVTKSGSPATQVLGTGNITWTMVVTNKGPSTATGVEITDPMPAGNTFVSATSSQGTCTGGAILHCTIGTMTAGQSVTITLVTTPSTTGTQTNTVNVSGSRPETNTGNNSATATVEVTPQKFPPPVKPCVAVSKVTPKQLFVGRKTALKIHVTQGGKAVKGIHVRIKGPKVNIRTKASNSKGLITKTIKLKKAGVLVFTPIASKACNTKRVGVTNVFTPPVTG